jgi:Fic family protein
MNTRDFHSDIPFNSLPDLPPAEQVETLEVMKATVEANRLLGELKGYCQTLPNPNLLLNTIVLQESKNSSAIENIVTTQDELYKAAISPEDKLTDAAAKEVLLYRQAIYFGLEQMEKTGLITTNLLVGIMQKLKGTQAGIRKGIGTKLANPMTGKIVYTPPEGEELIREKLFALEKFINDDTLSSLDPIIKMALIHYQFEAIHPFADGNGRTGRILNVLYLINKTLLPLPVLYLSYFIIHHKNEYYGLLKGVTEQGEWLPWIKYVLKAAAETSSITLQKIDAIQQLKRDMEMPMKTALKTSFSKELMDLLFSYPYMKIKILEENGIAKRQTASIYLQSLAEHKLLRSIKMGKEVYYVNYQLMNILTQ